MEILQTAWQDLRYSVRILLKKPGFTVIAVITLALGIGANTAIFSVVNAVLLKPLPYAEADRLVYLSERHPQYEEMSISYPDFTDWRAQNHVFEHIGVYNFGDYNLTGSGEPARLRGGRASADLFTALRVRAALGRLFTNDEDKPGAPGVVVLSHELWRQRFGSAPNILSQSLTLNDRPYTVIGVLPPDFRFERGTQLWVPVGQLSDRPSWLERDNHPGLRGVARLNAGETLEQARSELDAIAAQLEQQYPNSNKHVGARIIPLLDNYVRNVRAALWVLLGAVGLVLLIACANVANLMLAHGAARRRELAVRVALGTPRWRIVYQSLTESLLLAAAGGSFGLVLAEWGVSLILGFSGDSIPRASEIGIDNRVLLFTLASAVLTGIIFGLAPALQAGRTDVQEALKETARGTSGGRHRLRQALVVAEISLTLVLLIGAGLLIRSFYRLQLVNSGFVEENVLSFSVSLPEQRYPDEQQWINFYRQVLEKLRALPGVKEVSLASRLPMGGNDWQSGFSLVGQPLPPPGQRPSMEVSVVGPDYFHAMGIPLLRGRWFTEQDNRAGLSAEKLRGFNQRQRLRLGLKSIIIDEEFARKHWPNQDAVGKQILWAPDDPPVTVIGVVGSVKLYRPNEPAGFVQGYFPFFEMPESGMSFVLKTTLDPEQFVSAARLQVQAVDPNQPIYNINTLAQLHSEAIAPQRFNLLLLGLFAAVALALAVVGIYGVMNYVVAQRTHEIGLRVALGAQTRDVSKLVLGQAMKLALVGIALGLAGAAALTRLMTSLLFGVSATDPLTFSTIAVFLPLVALLACWKAVRRATQVDPLIALRYE
jgi:putative ABC transport system permease protein